jgi:hypothetical protein
LLAAAGLLQGWRATTHWAYRAQLASMGAEVVDERFVFDGRIVTAAGVSAGIDMALALIGRQLGPEAAKMVQLAIEYDPQPPFDSGSPRKAGDEIWTFQPQEPIRMADHRRSHGRASRPRRSRSRRACKRPGTAPPRSPHRAIRANGRSLASPPAARQHPRSRPAGECFLAGYLSSARSNSPVW